jgi:Uma2 family endonuclease
MKILTADPPPQEMEAVLARRKELGQDTYDEMWEGVYHMAPSPFPWHGIVQAEVLSILRTAALKRGLVVTGPFNLGDDKDSYRCPDAGVHETIPEALYVPTALVVVEIVSPGDDTFKKFDFYWEHMVEEILTVQRDRRVQFWERRSDYRQTAESDILGLYGAVLRDDITWP